MPCRAAPRRAAPLGAVCVVPSGTSRRRAQRTVSRVAATANSQSSLTRKLFLNEVAEVDEYLRRFEAREVAAARQL